MFITSVLRRQTSRFLELSGQSAYLVSSRLVRDPVSKKKKR